MSGKWLELLKEVAPGVTRVAVLRDPAERLGGREIDDKLEFAHCTTGRSAGSSPLRMLPGELYQLFGRIKSCRTEIRGQAELVA